MTGIMRMMDVATNHITEKAADYLNTLVRSDDYKASLIVYEKAEYGWFLYVPDEIETAMTSFDCLNLLFQEAKQRDCNWIMLDSDGEEWPDIPSYDW